MSWIDVDLDGTLAHYDHWRGVDHIGAPIPKMVARVKAWLAEGKTVKIFTARMHGHGMPIIETGDDAKWSTDPKPEGQRKTDVVTPIQNWCHSHIGQVLEVTNIKDFAMVELWDDRAVQVIVNTGERADGREAV